MSKAAPKLHDLSHLTNVHSEQCYLAACVQNRQRFEDTLELLTADDFDYPPHRAIFECLRVLFIASPATDRTKPFDTAAMSAWLTNIRDNDAAGYLYTGLQEAMDRQKDNPVDVETHAKTVASLSRVRSVLKRLRQIDHQTCTSFDEKTFNEGIMQIASDVCRLSTAKAKIVAIEDTAKAALDRLVFRRDEALAGRSFDIQTGMDPIDAFFRMRQKEFSIIAARPGCGKTGLMLQTFGHIVFNLRQPAMFVELEIDQDQSMARLWSAFGNHKFGRLMDPKCLTDDDIHDLREINAAMQGSGGVTIHRGPNMTVHEFRAEVRLAKLRFPEMKFVGLDGLWLLQHDGGTTTEGYGNSTRELKSIASDYDVHLMVVHQLNRPRSQGGVGGDDDKEEDLTIRPTLQRLRGSGDIEQDAAAVMLMYRGEKTIRIDKATNRPLPVLSYVDLAKNRTGQTRSRLGLFYDMEIQRFLNPLPNNGSVPWRRFRTIHRGEVNEL